MEHLPPDLLAKQITYLPFRDVGSLCRINQRLHDFCIANTERSQIIWKNLIQNAFSNTTNYENNLRRLSRKYCGTDRCYNYLVYVNFIKLLDPVTQAMIYYRQNDKESLDTLSNEVKFFASFLLGNINEMKNNLEPGWNMSVYSLSMEVLKPSMEPEEKTKLLVEVTKKGYFPMIKYLIDSGADVNTNNGFLLIWAVEKKNSPLVRLLLGKGANIHAQNDSALMAAIDSESVTMMKYLLQKGADVNMGRDYPVRWAAGTGRLDLVKYLINLGADVRAENDDALRWAAEEGHLDVVEYLVEEQGADIRSLSRPELDRINRDHYEVIDYLVSKGLIYED